MYTAKGQLDLNSTLKQYSGLVRRLAHQMIAKLPANVEIDDLIQVGMIGLTDALSRFDAAQGVQFETFATQRIRGAMLDELRGSDYLSRGTRKQQRSIEQAVAKLEQQFGRAPVESEIAKEMGVSLTEYQELLGKVRDLALRIAANGPLAVAAAKQLLHDGQSQPLDEALAAEQRAFGQLFTTAAQREGMTAFLAKPRRPAKFEGR